LGICRFQGALPRGSALVALVGYALNSVIASYPEFEGAIRATLTPRGEDLLSKVADQCIAETVAKFMFRHLQPYFNEDICLGRYPRSQGRSRATRGEVTECSSRSRASTAQASAR
jgi:hypothetical protein